MPRGRASGFTLIELVAVIVVLAVVASAAVPRMNDLRRQSRAASLDGLAAAVRSAATAAHMRMVVLDAALNATVQLEGANVVLFNGYPRASTGGINTAISFNATDYLFCTGATTSRFRLRSVSSVCTGTVNCEVRYTRSSAANRFPTITVVSSSC